VTGPDRKVELVDGGRPGAYLLRIDGDDQSYVDLGDPTRLEFDYVRRMGDVLDVQGPAGQPLRVVHVGGAGLTLPRYVAATRPGSVQVVLEPDERVTALVRERLPWPRGDRIKVRATDGRSGIEGLRDDYADVVVLDAYLRGQVPPDLVTAECFQAVRRVLRADGAFLLNLSDRAPFAHTRRVVAGLRRHFARLVLTAEPATLRARRAGNLLVVAGVDSLTADALQSRVAASALPYRVLGDDQVRSSFGGGRPFADDASSSRCAGPRDRLDGS
jgi:spermidine synthase